MPHRSGVNGASLVPDLTSSLNLLLGAFGTKQERDEKERLRNLEEEKRQGIKRETEVLTDPNATDQQKEAANIRLTIFNPQAAAEVGKIIERGDKNELAELAEMTRKGLAQNAFVKQGKTHGERIQRLTRIAQEKARDGEDMGEILRLINLDKDTLNTELLRKEIMGRDLKTLATPKEPKLPPSREVKRGGQIVTEQLSPTGSVEEIGTSPQFRSGQTKAPQTREVKRGGQIITEQFDPKTNTFVFVGSAPAVQPQAVKPASEIAKLNQDFKSGLITLDQFQEGRERIKQKSRTTLQRNLQSAGIEFDESGKIVKEADRELAIKAITKPRVKIDINKENQGLFKTPKNYMLLDQNDPVKGVTPIPGGPADSLKGELAGKTAMLRTAQKGAKGIRDLVFDKDGNVDRINLFNAAANTPFTKGRELRVKMEFGIQAITRLETGAAMPPSEVDNTRTRFQPKVGDSDKVINIKLQMFDEFLNGTLKLIDPTGRFNAERFDAELQTRSGGESVGEPKKRKTFNLETGRVE